MVQCTPLRTARLPSLRTGIGLLVLLFTASPTLAQYCAAGASTAGAAGITQVTFNTINNSSASSPAYTDFTAQSTTVMHGSTHALSVQIVATGSGIGFTTNTAQAWIDWNQNGTFESSEAYSLGTLASGLFSANNEGLTSSSPVSITVPGTALTGPTRMRIRTRRGTAPSACGNTNNSEAEDYTINVMALASCSGTPDPGLTTASDETPCPGASVTLDFQHHSSDLGLTYQWQSSTTGAPGSFANNGLGTATSQVTTPAVPTWYQMAMTCAGNTGYSVPVLVTPGLSGACYCAVSANNDDNTGLTFVGFNTISNESAGGPAYSDYSALTTTVEMGSTLPLLARVNTDGNYTVHVSAWFDWDQNGVFDASERYELGTATNVTDGAPSGSPANISIPLTALPGTTVMRVRARYDAAPTPCGNNNYSEAEDYTLNLVVPPPCTGIPYPGNTTATTATPCPGSSVTLGFDQVVSGLGLTYQWQSSTAGPGGPFADNGLGTATTQAVVPGAATWYRVAVTCDGHTGFSTPIELTPALTVACYCAATATSNDATGVTNVSFNTLDNSSTGTPAYSDFSAQSTMVNGGQSYELSVSVNAPNWFTTVSAMAWIDWNRNGIFESTEAYNLGSIATTLGAAEGPTSGSPLNITVPLDALGGLTTMRIRAGASVPGACGNLNNSEAEDYTLDVHPQVSCSGTPYPGNTTSSHIAPCFDSDFTLDVQYPSTDIGLSYQWQSSTSGPGGPFANNGLGTAATQVTSASVPTWYRVLVTCSGNTGTSSPIAITPIANGAACYCAATASSNDATGIMNVTFNTIDMSTSSAPAYTDLSATTTIVYAGETYPLSVTANAPGLSIAATRAWIDWDQDGTFETSESYDLGYVFLGSGVTDGSPANVTVPLTAVGGRTIMRVRTASGSAPSPCGNANNSEAEDYTIFVVPEHNTCATAFPIACGDTYQGRTNGVAHSMPANACPFNGAASTGGQDWWSYTASVDETVTVSTCGEADFNTRISVFAGTDCNDLACVALGDDYPGCVNGSSIVSFNAVGGNTYLIVVHGDGAEEGSYTLSTSCAPICTPPANDLCANAQPIASTLLDGSGVPAQFTNVCATGDGPTACSGAMPVQGVWFSFNSGAYDHAVLSLLDNGEDAQYTASALSFALYTGSCTGLGASGSAACAADGAGTHVLNVAPDTDYLLLVHNTGGSGVAGTFGLLLEHPAHDDAAITAILDPAPGLYCSSSMAPTVTLLNNGDNDLTSVQITYGLSGGSPFTYNWSGSLAYGQSEDVVPPSMPAAPGMAQLLSIHASLPNGVTDGLPANDAQGITLDVGGEGLMVNIMTDDSPEGLSWMIFDNATFDVVASGGGYTQANALISEQHCLSTDNSNCYIFMITDDFGDGLCCDNGQGYWELRTPQGGLLLRDLFDAEVDGQASPSYTPLNPNYGFGHNICLPAGPGNIAPTECGIFNNALGNKVYANKVAGASNYQFEFTDPDAGFIRRIARPYNYVHFWDMVSTPLVPGVKYFARVRTDRDGPMQQAHFGTGCEMGIGLPQVVTCSELIQAPAYGHSCNETRAFNTNNSFIWAKPVVGATEYQFRIFNAQEGYDQTFIRSTYILQLKWNSTVAPPLINGYTYQVEINVKVNGTYSGFCASSCTITIDNSGNQVSNPEGRQVQVLGDATLWPNPVRDGQVNLSLDGLAGVEQTILVDVQDIHGKQVFAKEYGNSGERFTTVLQLPSEVASGVYLVGITMNGERTVQRLSVIR